MIRMRHDAYLSALTVLGGTVLIALAVRLPAITASTAGLSFGHLSFSLSGDVNSNIDGAIVWVLCFWIVVVAAFLAMTRRRGWGIAWRLAIASLVATPIAITVGLWRDVIDPSGMANDPIASDMSKVIGTARSVPLLDQVTSVEPAPGLWLLSLGCLVVAVGALMPAKKQLVIEEDDPGFNQYDPYIHRFRQYQADSRIPIPAIRQRDRTWRQPPDPYGPPSYHG